MTGAHANNWRWFNEAERHRQLTTRTQQASNLAASRKSPQTGRYGEKRQSEESARALQDYRNAQRAVFERMVAKTCLLSVLHVPSMRCAH